MMMGGNTDNNLNATNNVNTLNNQGTTPQYVDQLGNPIDPSLIDADGNYIGTPQVQQTPQYVDEFGNPIDPSLIDANGNYIGAPTAPQYVDEFGNPIDPSLIDANGNYIGAPTAPQYVDEQGNPIDPSLIDANGNYIGNANTIPPVINEQALAQELNNAAGNIVETQPTSAAISAAETKELLSGMVTFDYNNVPITDIVNSIILDAINKGASDIHFDPFDEGIKIRLRIDGELNDYSIVPLYVKRNMITRIKIISGMNITESRTPQDGAIRTELQNKTIDLRVSCLPTNVGEKIVIRIMDYSMSAQGIDALDFSENNLDKVKRMLELPNGIILVTGATGSGKSTTVYSMLQRLNVEDTNLITVEDPIEMNIGGINQVQAQADIGLTFAAVLRSILRQDPDVIMIGEIRDDETARIAVRAAITGHLVLSTIHTNNSLNTIERLTDMSVERYLLGSALSGIISQKLARRLCEKCKRLRKTTDYEKSIFKTALEKDVDEIYEPVGCHECSRGYRGRIAVHEVLLLNQKIRDAITKGVPKEELRALVYSHHGTTTMLEDGLEKVLEGKTSFEEILKMIDLEDDLGTGTQLGLVNQIEAATYNNDNENANLLKTPETSGPKSTTIPQEEAKIAKLGPSLPTNNESNNTSNITTAQLSGPINLNIPPELIASLSGLTNLKNIADELAKVTSTEEENDEEEVEEKIIRKRKKKPKKVIIEEIVDEDDDDDEPETIIRRVSSKDIKNEDKIEETPDDDIGSKLFEEIDEIRENIPEIEVSPTSSADEVETTTDDLETIEEIKPIEETDTLDNENEEVIEQIDDETDDIKDNESIEEESYADIELIDTTQDEDAIEQVESIEESNEVLEENEELLETIDEEPQELENTEEISDDDNVFEELEDIEEFDNSPIYIDLRDVEYLTSLVQSINVKEIETIDITNDPIGLDELDIVEYENTNIDNIPIDEIGFKEIEEDNEEPQTTQNDFNLTDGDIDNLLDVLEGE